MIKERKKKISNLEKESKKAAISPKDKKRPHFGNILHQILLENQKDHQLKKEQNKRTTKLTNHKKQNKYIESIYESTPEEIIVQKIVQGVQYIYIYI